MARYPEFGGGFLRYSLRAFGQEVVRSDHCILAGELKTLKCEVTVTDDKGKYSTYEHVAEAIAKCTQEKGLGMLVQCTWSESVTLDLHNGQGVQVYPNSVVFAESEYRLTLNKKKDFVRVKLVNSSRHDDFTLLFNGM